MRQVVWCGVVIGVLCSLGCDPEPEEQAPADMMMAPVDMPAVPEDQGDSQDMPVDVQDLADTQDMPADLVEEMPQDMPDMPSGPMLEPLPDLSTYTACAPYVEPGPFVAGVTTIQVDGSPVEVFYPSSQAVDGTMARASYDLRDWLPDGARQMIPDAEPTTFEMMAYRDVTFDTEMPRPVVIFSHGFAGYRLQSSFLLAHLASWGVVVASAEHPGRGLAAVLTDALAADEDVAIVSGVLSELERVNTEGSGSMFEGALDLERVAMSGHSAGGAASIELGQTLPDRFDTVIGYTPAVKSFDGMMFLDPLPGRKLFISGSKDGLTTARDISAYSQMQDPVWRHIEIDGAGHLAFTDICVIGREKGGILKIAENNGVEVPLLVSILATDGCRRNDLRAEIAWPMIAHFTVAELFDVWQMGDPLDAYLDEDAAACFGDLTKTFEQSE